MKSRQIGRVTWGLCIFLSICSGGVDFINGQCADKGAGVQNSFPVIHSSDLFHPHGDPDDHFDFATIHALPEIDLKAIILDNPGGRQFDRPGGVPAAQMNMITGRLIPKAVGLGVGLKSPTDDGLDQPSTSQSGVYLILNVLRQSDKPVTITIVGSARDLAAAYNREPE